MKQIIKSGVGLIALTALSGCFHKKEKEPANVLLIVVDDLGWKDLGCYGSEFYETPSIDELARESALFTQAYAASPVCSPTRAAILTGRHPVRVNITDWIPGHKIQDPKLKTPEDLFHLPHNETTLAESFKNKGYDCWFIGKWHLGDEGYFPVDQGFDINIGGNHTGHPAGGYYSPYKNPELPDGSEGEYLTDRLTNEAITLLEQRSDKPFFMELAYYTVHTPIQANKIHHEKFRMKRESLKFDNPDSTLIERDSRTRIYQANDSYASMIAAMDENIGRIMNYLDESGLRDNTLLIFTSDNGGLSTQAAKHGYAPTSLLPLRAGKGWCYEAGIRIPLLIRYPGIIKPGTVCNSPVISMDLYPTILSLCGFQPEPENHIDGMNLKPLLLENESIEREILYWHFPHYHASGWTPGSAIRKGNWKLIKFYHWGERELYNLEDDPGELNNLSEKYPELTEELDLLLIQEIEAMGGEFPIEIHEE